MISIYDYMTTELGTGQPRKIVYHQDGTVTVDLCHKQERPVKSGELEGEGIGYWIIEDDNIVQ